MEYKQTYIKIGKHVFQDTSIHRKLKKKNKESRKKSNWLCLFYIFIRSVIGTRFENLLKIS